TSGPRSTSTTSPTRPSGARPGTGGDGRSAASFAPSSRFRMESCARWGIDRRATPRRDEAVPRPQPSVKVAIRWVCCRSLPSMSGHTEPLRILQVSSYFGGGGVDGQTLELATALQGLGDDVTLSVPAGSRWARLARLRGLRVEASPRHGA